MQKEVINMALTAEQKKFIEDIAKYVQKYAYVYGIMVHSPIIAQAIIESGWGKSRLSADYHNYFGLKCGSKWTGPSVNMTTKEEYEPGTLTTIKDNFRVYANMEEGVKGYFEFIQLARYENLRGITDPKKYIETIKADGYATRSTYVDSVYKAVELYSLTQYNHKEEKKMSYIRSVVVGIMQSWIGKNEADGSHRSIVDIYNTISPRPRGYKVQYSDAWCAATVSAAFHKAGYDAIFPAECGCGAMINKAKEMGIWQESDAYVPSPGDCVLYDWDDNGVGDNVGYPEHVGMVESCNGKTITVIEGNYSNSVKRRSLAVNGRYIRGYVVPKFTAAAAPQATPVQGSSSGTSLNRTPKWNGVVTTGLNVRTWAGTEYGKCSFSPLPKGAVVGVCDSVKAKDGSIWYYIKYNGKYGFSHSAYITKQS